MTRPDPLDRDDFLSLYVGMLRMAWHLLPKGSAVRGLGHVNLIRNAVLSPDEIVDHVCLVRSEGA